MKKNLIAAKRFHIMVHNIHRFIRDYDKIIYSVLFGPEKCDAILIGLDIL